jgi:opacity protein-like surface antigen
MRKLIVAAALLLSAQAQAADLSIPRLKAPAYVAPICTAGTPMTPTMAAVAPSCSGFYGGFSVQGLGSNLDILGSGINNSVFAGGAIVGGVAGWQFWNGQFFFAGEADLGLNVQTNGLNSAAGFKNWDGGIFVKAGVGLANVIGIGAPGSVGAGTPSQGINLAIIPGTSLMSPYVVIGDSFKQGDQGFTAGAGVEFILAQGWNLDVYYHHINWNSTQSVPIPGAMVTTTKPENRVGVAFLKMF